jgi:hypothetical protein
MALFGSQAEAQQDLPSVRIWQRGKAGQLGQSCEDVEWSCTRDFPHDASTLSPTRRDFPLAHDTATAACGNTDMDATDGHYGESARAASTNMDLQHCVGTGQLPLAGAILCCTALPHEQRVGRPCVRDNQPLICSDRHNSRPLARRWAQPSSSTSPPT